MIVARGPSRLDERCRDGESGGGTGDEARQTRGMHSGFLSGRWTPGGPATPMAAYPDSVATASVRYIQRSNQAGTRLLQLLGSPLLWVIEEVAMGIYAEQVLPRMINAACGMRSSNPLRSRVCEGLHGQVVEIGFGSGHNIPFYPAAVASVAAIEPANLGWKLAGERLAASTVPVERSGLDGQALSLPDDSCDTALSTWTLCTIPDVVVALAEVRRVLKPGGTLHFVEHGLAPDENVQRWQHRLEPMQKRLFGGCHLTRSIADLLSDAGFEITEVEVFYEKGAPKFLAADSLGVAVAP